MTTSIALARHFAIVREDLHRHYDQALAPQEIDTILDDTIAELEAHAKVETFLPVLAEREATDRITTLIKQDGMDAHERKEVLFADERGSGRCQVASAILHHLVGDAVFVRSTGLHSDGLLDERLLTRLAARGIDISCAKQMHITPRLSHRADVAVMMGIDEAPGVPATRTVAWDIPDPAQADDSQLDAIIDAIDAHVRVLLVELGVAI